MNQSKNGPAGDLLTVGLAQISPVWLNRRQTLGKMVEYVDRAASQGCRLVVFGEGLLPGYPFWIERTGGAVFNSPVQKDLHAHYLQEAVQIEAGHLQPLCEAAARHQIVVMAGCIERAADRGGHSLYCSLVCIDAEGAILWVHRKLMPTHEERLTWAAGDGHGLRVHPVGAFTLGGLNCWENWMPLARTALYGQGEDLHVALWPGGEQNTSDITRFMAKEGRSFVISVSGLMSRDLVPSDLPHAEKMLAHPDHWWANGGSCIAGPDGQWVVEPVLEKEDLIVATLDHNRIREERHNFDAVGHYSRPDVLRLVLNRKRQGVLEIDPDQG